jgi:phosphohistidine phosphatase
VKVYLVRHGKAADSGYAVDEQRPLTEIGRILMRRTARAWAKRGKEPELWLVSPLVRAVQTCEICVEAFGSERPVEVTVALVSEARVSDAAALFDRPEVDSIAVVSHNPLMSDLASHLLGQEFGDFKKGMVMALELRDSHPARLRGILEPAREGHEPRFREEL